MKRLGKTATGLLAAALFLTAAAGTASAGRAKIPESIVISGGEDGERIAYIQSTFFENGYFLEASWGRGDDNTPLTVLTVDFSPSPTPCHVAFTETTKKYAQIGAVRIAVQDMLVHIGSNWMKDSGLDLYSFSILRVDGPYTQPAEELLGRFYQEDNVSYFSAVAPKASQSSKVGQAQIAYQDGRIDFFSVLSHELDEKKRGEYLERAYQDGRIDFFSVLSHELEEKKRGEYLERAYQDGRINFFSVLSHELEEKKRGEYLERAYQDGRIDFFSVLSHELEEKKRGEYLERASMDKRMNFYYILNKDG